MRFMRIGVRGSERPVVVTPAGQLYDLSPVTPDIDGDFFAGDGIAKTRAALSTRSLRRIEAGKDRVGAPIARPGAVVCLGANYAAHAAESGMTPPAYPVVFFKHPNTVVGPFDEIRMPAGSEKLDWEVELALVIGATAAGLRSDAEALDCIAGVTIANDVSERAFQLEISGGQWSKGKSAPTFCPVGPALVPIDQIDDVQDLRLQSWVNGQARQDSSTADMIFSVATIVRELSQVMTLDPGDLVLTGTPEGVALSGRFPYLVDGDTIEAGHRRPRRAAPASDPRASRRGIRAGRLSRPRT
ncbi:MAG: fumarylacetoacetate hydrolase family protein [Actinomycetales bacterium]|nr:fumarylacetoacetate hydrolase family protein [Actinomycetales bacterium]